MAPGRSIFHKQIHCGARGDRSGVLRAKRQSSSSAISALDFPVPSPMRGPDRWATSRTNSTVSIAPGRPVDRHSAPRAASPPPLALTALLGPDVALRSGETSDAGGTTPAGPQRRLPDAAGVHPRGPQEAEQQHLGLPDRRHRDRDDHAAQPHGARLHRLPPARLPQRFEGGHVHHIPEHVVTHSGDAGAGRIAGIVPPGRRRHG